jgi:diguanylate cyclase (GGDEF)-like protein
MDMSETNSPLQQAAIGGSDIGRGKRWFAWALIATLVGAGIAVTPFAGISMTARPSILPMFQASLFVVSMLLTALLFIKGKCEQNGDAIRLGAAYLCLALMIIPQTIIVSGEFLPSPGDQAPILLWSFWHVGFGLAILRYAWFARMPEPPDSSVLVSVLAVGILAGLVTSGVSFWPQILAVLTANGLFMPTPPSLAIWGAAAVVTLGAFLSIARLRMPPRQSWLAVGLVAAGLDVWFRLLSPDPYRLGWYASLAAGLMISLPVLLSLLHDISGLYRDAAAKIAELRLTALDDALTGISNRLRFDEVLQDEFRRARRLQLSLGLVMLDIDYFTSYNQRYGHLGADDCFRRLALAVKSALWRSGDHVARYDGAKLAVLLPATDEYGALRLAARLREAVMAMEIEHSGSPFGKVTVSCGVASLVPYLAEHSEADLLEAADRALYNAKLDGRNRVRAEQPPGSRSAGPVFREGGSNGDAARTSPVLMRVRT